MKARYVNPFTDFGFKKIFGEEASKPLLIDFLNSMLPPEHMVFDLAFKNTEQLGQAMADRRAVYDIYCQNAKGERFIVELQKAKQNFFKERTIYYSTFPIREQAERGDWDYNLKAVYCIGILDFTFDDYADEPSRHDVLHTVKLKDQHGHVFYKKLTYIYLEMPNFNKGVLALESQLDKWLFFIKNLESLQDIPNLFANSVFETAFEKAELAKMSHEELINYENSLKSYRDLKGVIETAFEEGKEEGINIGVEKGITIGVEKGVNIGVEKEKEKIASAAIKAGLSDDLIKELTGLTDSEIEKLKQNQNSTP
jgi:predicted transposase/invertase (TIGR01784 family)